MLSRKPSSPAGGCRWPPVPAGERVHFRRHRVGVHGLAGLYREPDAHVRLVGGHEQRVAARLEDPVQQGAQALQDVHRVVRVARAVDPALHGEMGAGQPVPEGGFGLRDAGGGVVQQLGHPVLPQRAPAAHPAFAFLLVGAGDLFADPVDVRRG